MRKAGDEFAQAVNDIPCHCAVFKVVRLLPWMARLGVRRGQEVRVYSDMPESVWCVIDGQTQHLYSVAYSAIKFLRYEQFTVAPWARGSAVYWPRQ